MTEHLAPWVLSAVSGAVIAAQDVPGVEIADRIGVAVIATMVVGWMLTSFSKRLDRLTAAIDRLSGQKSKEPDAE